MGLRCLLLVRVLGVRCGVVGVCVFVRMPGVFVCYFLVVAVSFFRLAVRIHVCFVVCVVHMLMWVCLSLCSWCVLCVFVLGLACLAYVIKFACVACELVYTAFFVVWFLCVLLVFYEVLYLICTPVCYL